MALQDYQLRVAGSLASSTKAGIIPVKAYLTTTESPVAVEAPGYFNIAAKRLPKGSQIDATMSHGGAPVFKSYVVVSNDGAAVAVAGQDQGESLAAASREVVPTADGLTTGLILASDEAISVASGNADHIATLPPIADVPLLKEIWGQNGGTAFEMRTPATSNTFINGADADASESVVAANAAFMVKKVSATRWVLMTFAGATIAAPAPD